MIQNQKIYIKNEVIKLPKVTLTKNGKERLYSLADPNWNVVALVDVGGNVKERFNYDAFGKRSATEFDWNRAFTGQVLDVETGLMLYRERYYSTELGRFVTRDPIGYESEDNNLYRYVANQSPNGTDVYGHAHRLVYVDRLINEAIAENNVTRLREILNEMALTPERINTVNKAIEEIENSQCKKQKKCKPCVPPAGSKIVDHIDAPGHQHGPHLAETGHIHYRIVNQTPYPECACKANKSGRYTISGNEVPSDFYPQGTLVTGGVPAS